MVTLTQKNFDVFCDALNHRMTRVEKGVSILTSDVKWLKAIGLFIAAQLTIGIITIIFKSL